jgi:hypothetical protein
MAPGAFPLELSRRLYFNLLFRNRKYQPTGLGNRQLAVRIFAQIGLLIKFDLLLTAKSRFPNTDC